MRMKNSTDGLVGVVLLLAILLATLRFNANAQTLQVVTKIVEKTIPCPDGLTQRVRINARKADVQVRGWNRPVVGVRLRLVAKHADRAVAEREVAYHQYTLGTEGPVIELANQFVIPQRAGQLQSGLKAIYEVSVPNRAVLTVTNSFGDINMHDLTGETTVTFEYGKLVMEALQGKVTIKATYGDVEGKRLTSSLICTGEKSGIIFREHGGTSRIKVHYGHLYIFPNAKTLDGLNIEADRTEIALLHQEVEDFAYAMTVEYNRLFIPDPIWTDYLKRSRGLEQFQYHPSNRKPSIQLVNKFGPVHLMLFKGVEAPIGSK
jgi:hypothetical protein